MLFAFLSRLTPEAQIAWLRRQPADIQSALHRRWGFGAADCDCPPRWIPCAIHAGDRSRLLALALESESRRAAFEGIMPPSAAEFHTFTTARLFRLAFPELDGAERCDCPKQLEPCAHAKNAPPSPLAEAARIELLRLVTPEELVEPPAPVVASDCWTEAAKASDMGERLAAGFGLYHPGDALQRKAVVDDALARRSIRLRNGAFVRGAIIFEHAADDWDEDAPEGIEEGWSVAVELEAWRKKQHHRIAA